MKRLFIVDLDGTLLSAGSLPPNTAPVIRRLFAENAPITIATARGVRAALSPLAGAVPSLPVIALNGAVIASVGNGETIVERMDPEVVDLVCQVGSRHGSPPCILASNGMRETVFAPSPGHDFTDWSIDTATYFKQSNLVRVSLLSFAEHETTVRIVFCDGRELLERIESDLRRHGDSLSVVALLSRDRPGFGWLEVGAPTATKERAVGRVASRLGLTLKDVVYYGDAANDLAAMAAVGEAVAVANAEPAVLRTATRVAGEAESGAVAFDLESQLREDAN